MGPPEHIGVEAVQQFFERAAVGLSFHAAGAARHHRDHSILDGSETNVLLIHQEQASGGLQQDFGRLRLESSIRIRVSSFSDDGPLLSILARARSTD